MRIVIIRHADPDYPNNTLTPHGFEEAQALGTYLKDFHYDEMYVSTLNRARFTAEAISQYHTVKPHMCDWLWEFNHGVKLPYQEEKRITWDLLPSYYTCQDELYDKDRYLDTEMMRSGSIREEYEKVISRFDEILSAHGYVREGNLYRVDQANDDVLVFVCHFGMMTVLMSHLMNLPYVILANTTCAAPTGITTFASEERREGQAQFRMLSFSDTSHLSAAGYMPSFSGRFCEKFSDDTRHD